MSSNPTDIKTNPGNDLPDIAPIPGTDFELHQKAKYRYSGHDFPIYDFNIVKDGEIAGLFTVRLTNNFDHVAQEGNLGVQVDRRFHGHKLPKDATMAVLPLFKEHEIDSILMTCDEGKGAVQGACEEMFATFLDNKEFSGRRKNRYVLKF
jgi:predicted acetyltransferase